VTPIGTRMQAYDDPLRSSSVFDGDVRVPALTGKEGIWSSPEEGQDLTEAYLAQAADMAKTAFAGVAERDRNSQDFLSARTHLLGAMNALWGYQDGQVAPDMPSTETASNVGATILQFRRPGS
jgi:hypothetical protein